MTPRRTLRRCEGCGNRRPAADFREIADGWDCCADCWDDLDDEAVAAVLPETCRICRRPTAAPGCCDRCVADGLVGSDWDRAATAEAARKDAAR